MQIREQVKEMFGTADKGNLLDGDVYGEQDLKRDKIKLERQRKQLQKEMNEYGSEYKKLMKRGARASDHKRRQIAQQAKIAKKKYKIKKQQYKKNSVVMATIVTIEGARELQNMSNEDTTEIESLLHDSSVDAEAVQEEMMENMVQFDLDMQMMQEVQESLDIDIMGSTMDEMGDDELVEDMRRLAEGDLDEEELDVEAEIEETTSTEVSMSASTGGDLDDFEGEEIDLDEDIGI